MHRVLRTLGHPKAKRCFALLWLALVVTFAGATVMSYWSEIGFTTTPGNLYGFRLVEGQLRVFKGTRRGGWNEHVRGAWMPWDGRDLTNQPSFREGDILQRNQRVDAWPPFWNATRIGSTWTRQARDGVVTYQDFGRELETRAASGWLMWVTVSGPLWLGWLWGRRRVRVPGCCIKCGYDLRATPDICPECGTPAARPAA